MTAVLARAVAQWMAYNPGKRPEIRGLHSRSVDPGETRQVRSDPPGLFAPDIFVIARAEKDFILTEACSTPTGVVITVVNVSRTSMPRRFDGWLVGRSLSQRDDK